MTNEDKSSGELRVEPTECHGKITEIDTGIISASILATAVPLISIMRLLLEKGAFTQSDLHASLQNDLKLDSFPPEVRDLIEPIWNSIKSAFPEA